VIIDNLQVRLDDFRRREQKRLEKHKKSSPDELTVKHTHKHVHEVTTPLSPEKTKTHYVPIQLQMPPPPQPIIQQPPPPLQPQIQIIRDTSSPRRKNSVTTERYAELLRDVRH
jgi:hypothetical protein